MYTKKIAKGRQCCYFWSSHHFFHKEKPWKGYLYINILLISLIFTIIDWVIFISGKEFRKKKSFDKRFWEHLLINTKKHKIPSISYHSQDTLGEYLTLAALYLVINSIAKSLNKIDSQRYSLQKSSPFMRFCVEIHRW